MNAKRGFTLLEMLLVLAVVSVLALAGLSAYQQRLQSFKVEKTALQMQAIMEAAQAFYVDHSSNPPVQRWPAQESDFANYLSGNVLHTCPWVADTTQCYAISTPTTGTSFSVAVTIPTTQTNAAQIAQMIANRLPNAVVSGSTVTETLSKLPVGVSAAPPGFSIINIATVYNGMQLPLHPDRCEANTNHNVYFMLSNVVGCGYESQPGSSVTCTNTTQYGLDALAMNAFGFQQLPQVTPGQANPNFHLTSSVTNPSGTSLTVSMGGQYGQGTTGNPFGGFGGYHMSGVAIETCEPIANGETTEKVPTPAKFF